MDARRRVSKPTKLHAARVRPTPALIDGLCLGLTLCWDHGPPWTNDNAPPRMRMKFGCLCFRGPLTHTSFRFPFFEHSNVAKISSFPHQESISSKSLEKNGL